jgi:hypothetical protein
VFSPRGFSMNRTLIFACVLLAGCASSRFDSTSLSSQSKDPAAASAALPTSLTSVPVVEMQSLDDEERCRVERPTGSRIAVRRCYTLTAEQEQLQGIAARRELEDMRQRQIYQDQARRSIEAAQRQRAVGP